MVLRTSSQRTFGPLDLWAKGPRDLRTCGPKGSRVSMPSGPLDFPAEGINPGILESGVLETEDSDPELR